MYLHVLFAVMMVVLPIPPKSTLENVQGRAHDNNYDVYFHDVISDYVDQLYRFKEVWHIISGQDIGSLFNQYTPSLADETSIKYIKKCTVYLLAATVLYLYWINIVDPTFQIYWLEKQKVKQQQEKEEIKRQRLLKRAPCP